ncbi:MAG TPA: Spo0E family sporulation regulatory protein-aspartic acid phosphatase [Clostridium perfringens]|nr:Spo0E family sporulation regulatory protein-aspartic acid phosphatase [Clostridium perfringens]
MSLDYTDKLINISKIFIKDLNIGELRALTLAEKVLSKWIKGVERNMEEKEILEDLKKVVGEFYVKYPKSKVTLALSQILDILLVEYQKEIKRA